MGCQVMKFGDLVSLNLFKIPHYYSRIEVNDITNPFMQNGL